MSTGKAKHPWDGIIDHSLDGESRANEVIILLSTMCVVSTTAVALRIYARHVILQALGRDDWVMVTAQVCHG